MFNFIKNVTKIKLPLLSPFVVAFDTGTTNTRIGIKDKGVVLEEPSAIGLNLRSRDFIFFGQEAKMIIGKTPDFIKIISPMSHGVVSDFDAQVGLTKYLMKKSVEPYFKSYSLLKPQLQAVAAVPHIATEIEKKALEEVFSKIGFSSSFLVEKPIAASYGVGINILSHHPHLIINLGGGLIEASIVSGGGIVAEKTLKNAGNAMNHLIANYVYLKYGVVLGEATCDKLKINLLDFGENNKSLLVRGKSLENGLPKSLRIKSGDIKEALLTSFNQIIDNVKELIEMSPPEIVDEIYESGIYLTGGMAKAPAIDRYFSQELHIQTLVAQDPQSANIHGLLALSQKTEDLNKLMLNQF